MLLDRSMSGEHVWRVGMSGEHVCRAACHWRGRGVRGVQSVVPAWDICCEGDDQCLERHLSTAQQMQVRIHAVVSCPVRSMYEYEVLRILRTYICRYSSAYPDTLRDSSAVAAKRKKGEAGGTRKQGNKENLGRRGLQRYRSTNTDGLTNGMEHRLLIHVCIISKLGSQKESPDGEYAERRGLVRGVGGRCNGLDAM